MGIHLRTQPTRGRTPVTVSTWVLWPPRKVLVRRTDVLGPFGDPTSTVSPSSTSRREVTVPPGRRTQMPYPRITLFVLVSPPSPSASLRTPPGGTEADTVSRTLYSLPPWGVGRGVPRGSPRITSGTPAHDVSTSGGLSSLPHYRDDADDGTPRTPRGNPGPTPP